MKNRPGAKQKAASLGIALIAIAVGIAVPLGIAGERAGFALPYVCVGAAVGLALGDAAFFSMPPSIATPVLAVSLFAAILVARLLGGAWDLALPAYIPASIGASIIGSHLRYLVDARKTATRAERTRH